MNSQETFDTIEIPVSPELHNESLLSQKDKTQQCENEYNKCIKQILEIDEAIEILKSVKETFKEKCIKPEDISILNLTIENAKKKIKGYSSCKKQLSKEQFGGTQTLVEGTQEAIRSLDEEIQEIRNYQIVQIKNSELSCSSFVLELNNLRLKLKEKLEKIKVKFLEKTNFDNKIITVSSENTYMLNLLTYIIKTKDVVIENDKVKLESSSIINNLKKYSENDTEILNNKVSEKYFLEVINAIKVLYSIGKPTKTSINEVVSKILENFFKICELNSDGSFRNSNSIDSKSLHVKSSISDNHFDATFSKVDFYFKLATYTLNKNIEINNFSKEQYELIFSFIEEFLNNENYLLNFIRHSKALSVYGCFAGDDYMLCYPLRDFFSSVYSYQTQVCFALYYLIKLSLES